jgi:quercetin dioxygenase-like cupin family protein
LEGTPAARLRVPPVRPHAVGKLHSYFTDGQVTLTAGQTFYEGPNDVHVVDRNASSTKPAKFVVFMIKGKGAPALVPAE